jgi:hypothetical protein
LKLRNRSFDSSDRRHAAVRLPIWLGFAALLAVIAVYYLLLLSNGTMQVFAPEFLDKVFDNMLAHMLHGEFNVDRDAIQVEAIIRNGKAYTYFGVFPALLRLLALPFIDLSQAHLARLSCLVGMVVFVAIQLRTLLLVHDSLPIAGRRPVFLAVMAAATVLSGPQLYLLGSAWVYHEPIIWSGAIAAIFNFFILRAALGQGLRASDLIWLAILAGVAFNTRGSVGVGLYVATFLLVLWSAWRWHRPARLSAAHAGSMATAIGAVARDPVIIVTLGILTALAVMAGIVNFERWGNPLIFGGDANNYIVLKEKPDEVRMFNTYGAFNIQRIWVGFLYYATGIPWLVKGITPFSGFLHARYHSIEGPPLVPLLTNPLTIILAGIGIYQLWRCPKSYPGGNPILWLTLAGHAVVIVIIFTVLSLTVRYRFDLAPFMTLAAFIGYRSFCLAAAEVGDASQKRLRIAAITLCLVGILFSHYTLLLHKAWSPSVPMEVRLSLRPLLPSTYLPVSGPFQ